jgi:putative membrane protein
MPANQKAPTAAPPSSNQLAGARTDLATARSVLASDRTLMAWVRTGLSMISFGFTIYKILDGFRASAEVVVEHSPRSVGLFLTGFGTLAIVMGTVDYWHNLKLLRAYHGIRTWRPSFVMALIMSATGVFLFVGIFARLL